MIRSHVPNPACQSGRACSQKRHPCQAGQNLIEFAIMLPILILLLIGTIEAVALANDYLNIQTSVREGARFGSHASVPASAEGAAQIQSLVYSQLQAKNRGGLDPARDILVIFGTLKAMGKGQIERVQFPASSATCVSELSAGDLLARAQEGGGMIDASFVGVEVCFDHPQVLGLPIVSEVFPNPVPIQVHVIMPRMTD